MGAIYKDGIQYSGTASATNMQINIGGNAVNLQTAIQNSVGNVAPIESNPTINAYQVGDLLVFNGILYEVTAAIAVGDTLVIGTNIVSTTVSQNKIGYNDIVDNATTSDSSKVASAAVAKSLQDQITTLNSKFVTVVYNGNLGALNAGASGYITASVVVPSGYITRGIASVAKQHIAGAPSLTIMPNVASNQSGTFTFYPSYYTVGAVADGQADFSIYILCSKD